MNIRFSGFFFCHYSPLNFREFLVVIFKFDDLKELGFVFRSEDSARDLSQELLEHGGDGVDREAVDVDQPALLEEVGQLADVQHLPRSAENVFFEGTLLVDLQKHDLREKRGKKY